MTKDEANELALGVYAEYDHSFVKMEYDLSVNLASLELMRNKTEAFLSWAKGKEVKGKEVEEAEYLNSASATLLAVFEKIKRWMYKGFWFELTGYSEECREARLDTSCLEICCGMIRKLSNLNDLTGKELRKKGIWGKKM